MTATVNTCLFTTSGYIHTIQRFLMTPQPSSATADPKQEQSENSTLKDTIKIIEAELSKAKRELEESKSREKHTKMKHEQLMQKLKSTKGFPLYKTIFTRGPSDEVQKRPKQSQVGPVPTIDKSSHYPISSDLDPISFLGTRTSRRGGGLTLKKFCSTPACITPALASLGISRNDSFPRNDSFSLLKRFSISGNSRLKKTHNHFINSSLRGGGLTLKKSCSTPACSKPARAPLGIYRNDSFPRNDSFSLLKRFSISGNSRLKKTHNNVFNNSLHPTRMGHSTSYSALFLSLLSDDDDDQDRRSSKSVMEAGMYSCPEPSSTLPRNFSFQDLADFNIIEENAKKTGEERLLVTLNDTNESTVIERNKAITVDSTEIKPAVDDKDLLIRALEIELLSRNETINCMEKTLLENIKNMQELHVAQHGL
jgi:hypothetical protein